MTVVLHRSLRCAAHVIRQPSDKSDKNEFRVAPVEEYVAAERRKDDANQETHPYSGKTIPHAILYSADVTQSLQTWWHKLEERKEAPTSQQLHFLQTLVRRVRAESEAEQTGTQKQIMEDSMFDMVVAFQDMEKAN